MNLNSNIWSPPEIAGISKDTKNHGKLEQLFNKMSFLDTIYIVDSINNNMR